MKTRLTRRWRPCHVCVRRGPQLQRPQLLKRAEVVGAEVVGIAGAPWPWAQGVDCDADLVLLGPLHVDRTTRHPLLPRCSQDSPRAAHHHHTANNQHISTCQLQQIQSTQFNLNHFFNHFYPIFLLEIFNF